jgi:hypothetical protein
MATLERIATGTPTQPEDAVNLQMLQESLPVIPPSRVVDVTPMFTFNPAVTDSVVEMIHTAGKKPRIRIKAQASPTAGDADLIITPAGGFGAYYNHTDRLAIIRPGKDLSTGSTGLYDITITGETDQAQSVITVKKEISDVQFEYFLGQTTAPKASYWVDSNGDSHPFELDDTPISAIATQGNETSEIRINNVAVIKNQIYEIHFGDSYKEILTIPDDLCADFVNLKDFSWPDTATAIGNYTFAGCDKLRLSSLPNNITSIGNSAFMMCMQLTITALPNNITSIGDSAFMNCSSISSLSIPSGITSISRFIFDGCILLRDINFNSVDISSSSFSPYAFNGLINTSACIRRHNTQALADAFGAKYTSMSNWTAVINT